MENFINVLDHGYVRLVDVMGSDLSVVNSARVSYNKEVKELSESDEKLIRFLAREQHTSPFRHAALQFEIHMPLMIARQFWKHVVASTHTDEQNAWNESSRRYITEENTYLLPSPSEWRSKPANSKQGSGDFLTSDVGTHLTVALDAYQTMGELLYQDAVEMGVAPEQARLFLPAYGIYVRFYWTTSLQAVSHMLNLRLDSHAQHEYQQYAKAIKDLTIDHFPVSLEELLKGE
ncbi:MAG TPA: FAD-dependent thymidylate synthase [Pseudoneobacillus sp.]|nr:FAD-dependent thymidylate synthase [Pseudoneobacillus sp.]